MFSPQTPEAAAGGAAVTARAESDPDGFPDSDEAMDRIEATADD